MSRALKIYTRQKTVAATVALNHPGLTAGADLKCLSVLSASSNSPKSLSFSETNYLCITVNESACLGAWQFVSAAFKSSACKGRPWPLKGKNSTAALRHKINFLSRK